MRGAFSFRGAMAEWPAWLDALLDQLDIDVILLFGDCRPIHVVAHETRHAARARGRGVRAKVYLRPHYDDASSATASTARTRCLATP